MIDRERKPAQRIYVGISGMVQKRLQMLLSPRLSVSVAKT